MAGGGSFLIVGVGWGVSEGWVVGTDVVGYNLGSTVQLDLGIISVSGPVVQL
jgi:hypothetical protein